MIYHVRESVESPSLSFCLYFSPLSLPPTLPPSHCPSLLPPSLYLYLSFCLSISLALSLSVSPFLSLSLSFHLFLSLFMHLHYLSLSLSLCLSNHLHYLSLSLSLHFPCTFCLPFSPSPILSCTLSLPLASLPPSTSIPTCLLHHNAPISYCILICYQQINIYFPFHLLHRSRGLHSFIFFIYSISYHHNEYSNDTRDTFTVQSNSSASIVITFCFDIFGFSDL